MDTDPAKAAILDETKPVVGIPACVRFMAPHPYYLAGAKYVKAVAEGAGALPWMLPPLGELYDMNALVDRLDGLFVTGSPSNVGPEHYGDTLRDPGTMLDAERDGTTLPLIRTAIARGVPMLAVCRGIQELNVVFGGTLHQAIQEVPHRLDHREDKSQPVEVQYGPAHGVSIVPGGVLANLLGPAASGDITVNSIHAQGIDRLGEGLAVEATAPDGQIEAVSVINAPALALAVQWHPEWRYWQDPHSTRLFEAFGEACRRRMQARISDGTRGRVA